MPVPVLSCAHHIMVINFCPVLVCALTCFTVPLILEFSCAAVMCVIPIPPENFVPKATALRKFLWLPNFGRMH
eukprot:15122266-Ditylum_brightwellii.AAC.1